MEVSGMKHTVMCFIVVLSIGTRLVAQTEVMYVKPNQENVRATPGGQKLGEILSGTPVRVLERQSNWAKVQFTVWIWDKSLTVDRTMVDGFTVQASHILVETEAQANELLEQIGQGGDFTEIAKQHSLDRASGAKGGDLGRFRRGDLRPEFEEVVFRLKVGEVSSVVKTDLGYHIVKRTG
jgi:hypothetical protein